MNRRWVRLAGHLVLIGLVWMGALVPAVASAPKITVVYVYTNPEGTPLARADDDGNIIARYDYKPYGAPVAPVPGQLPAGPGYTGHVNDPGTGLVYMQQRYYDPIGRFLSPDPVGPTPGNVFNFNRYSYANNNPIVNIDPTGMACFRGDDSHCNPEPTLPSPKPPQPSPPATPPPSPSPSNTATTLPDVPVTATAIPFVAPIGWVEVGGGLVVANPIPTLVVVALLYPTKMGAAPCEMPGGPLCGMMSGSFPPGYWPGDSGAAEWGRRNGVGAKEGKDRFHRGVKEHTPGKRGDHDYGVNPETGDVVDQNGEPVGNLNDE